MNEDEAKRRFLVLQLVRLIGVGFALFGLLVIAGKTSLSPMSGYVFFVFGLFDAMVAPILLSRRWKSGDK